MLDDDELMAMLEDALAPEQAVPASTLEAARTAFVWRRLDEELADLLFDSADYPVAAAMRGAPAGHRQVSYQCSDLLIECEVAPDALIGQLLPPAAITVELVTARGCRQPVDVDTGGRFVVRPLPSGPIRLRCGKHHQPAVLTPWLLV